MNIAVDVTPTESAHARRGVGVYTSFLVEALKKHKSPHTYSFFTRGQNVPENADIVHYPYFDPFFLTLPIRKRKPTVVTVHDLIPLVFPQQFPAGVRGNLRWVAQKLSLKGSARIITDSKSSKKDISRIVGFDADRIDVVYLAPTVQPVSGVPEGYPKRFILYVGDVNWNKNVQGFVQSLKELPGMALVLVGGAFMDDSLPETQEINALILALGVEKQIVRAGHVDKSTLAKLYGQAQCLVQPSFYEGFGLPVLDAFVCGCPVVTADNSSLAEIAGPAVRVSTDPSSIARGVKEALKRRTVLADKGREWVRSFTWDKVARETVRSYEKAINYHSRI